MRRTLRDSIALFSFPLVLVLLLNACSTTSSVTVTPAPSTTPATATPSATGTPTDPPVALTPVPATPTPSPTPPPELDPSPEPQVPLAELQASLDALLEANTAGGEYAFAVTDLQTGETVGIGLDRPHYTGCVSNFFVILQATIDVQEGRYEESLVGDLISRTIFSSNPVTARELYRIVGDGEVVRGVQRVVDLIELLELGDTILDHPPLYASESLGIDANNWSTATDTNRALAALYDGRLLTEEWRDYLLEKMTEVKVGLNYLTAYGPDVPVSHKNGFFPALDGWYVDNDIGIVRFERNGRQLAYAVSFFSQRVPKKYDEIPFAQRLTTTTWAFFEQRYPAAEVAAPSSISPSD